MATDGPSPDYGKLHETAAQLISGQLNAVLTSTTNRYLDLSVELEKTLLDYTAKMTKGGDTPNLSLFIFETKDTSTRLYDLLEETMQAEVESELSGLLDPIMEDVLRHFGLEDPKKQKTDAAEEPAEGPGRFIKPVTGYLKDLLDKLLDKVKGSAPPEDYTSNYILSYILLQSIEKNQEYFNGLYSSISSMMMELWKMSNVIHLKADGMVKADYEIQEIDDFINFEFDISTVKELREEVKSALDNLTSAIDKDFSERIGELKANQYRIADKSRDVLKQYNRKNTLRVLHKVNRSAGAQIGNWHRTLALISDDWLLELEIAKLKYNILLQSIEFNRFVVSRFREPLNSNIRRANDTIVELMDIFEKTASDPEKKLVDELQEIRINVKRKLVLKFVPEVKRIIIESNIPAQIDNFEQSTALQFTQLSKSRSIKKKSVYNEPTERSEVDKISPASLVSFQMMPEFMVEFPSLKQAFTRHLQEIQNRIEEIPEIIDYSLHSTLNYLEEKKDSKEAERIGMDGMKRAENKLQDIRELEETFFTQEIDSLKTQIEKLIESLSEITDNESALQIKFRIAKAKAIEKSKEYRKKILDYVRNFLPGIRQFITRAVKFLKESSIRIRKQFTLEDKKHYVATDVSDYLSETETAIARLPFIYQRLFRTEPLTTFELFTDRTEEIEKVKTAYTRWKAGKFAPTAVIAEKGWGKTTLINRFLKLKITTEEVVQFQPTPSMSMDEILSAILEKTTIKKKKQADEEDELGHPRKIFIFDGMERLFEARIDGFSAIAKFLQHISESNADIFWLITCHLYSWEYLDKTISISDYFGYHIKLPDFTNEALMKTIERRHNISGYRLMYLPETQKKAIISFKKQTDFGDQELLREEFFSRMHKTVKSNLSQAFLFWMRSTAHVTEDTVYIEHIGSEYINFLGSMSDMKLIILKFIVLQNGLSLEKFSDLMRLPEEKSRLFLDQLVGDGILVKKDDLYNVNPIIYRQVIDHLSLLNILH